MNIEANDKNDKNDKNEKNNLAESTQNALKGNKIRKNSGRNLAPKILSVIAAVTLWLYVFQAVEYEKTFVDIPINIDNFNTALDVDITSGYETSVNIKLSGTKSIINDIKSDDIRAYVDMSSVTEKGDYTFDINIEVPNGVNIIETSANQLKLNIDKTIEKQIEISTDINYNIQYPYELGEAVLSADFVQLSGPETDLNAIEKAVVQLNLGTIRNNIVSNVKIVLIDKSGYEITSNYISVTPSNIEVAIPVYKTSFFSVSSEAVYNTDKFDVTISPSTVYIKGAVNDVEAVSSVKTEKIWIDAPGEYTISLSLPKNVTAYTSYSATDETMVKTVKMTVTAKPVIAITDQQADT